MTVEAPEDPAGPSNRTSRILLVFVDGIGLAPASTDNPFSQCAAPYLFALLGGPLTTETLELHRDGRSEGPDVVLRGIDATLGVEGLPQSATGQTALFTGENAAQRLGHHVTAFPGPRLREMLLEGSIFRRVVEADRRATFANAFSPRYFELVEQRKMRYSASVWAARAGDLELRTVDDLRKGEALSWDITRTIFASDSSPSVDPLPARQAGAQLAALARCHHFTMFETFLTDLAGHGRIATSAGEIVTRIDELLEGVVTNLSADTTVVVTSDHGNFEELSHRRHTRNRVPLLAIGRDACAFADAGSLLDVTPMSLSLVC